MMWGQRQWVVLQKSEKSFMRCGAALNVLGDNALRLVRKLEVRYDAMIVIITLLLITWTYDSYTLRMSSSVAVLAHIASTTPRLDLFEYRWLCTLRVDFSWAQGPDIHQGARLANNLSCWGMTMSCETCAIGRLGCRKILWTCHRHLWQFARLVIDLHVNNFYLHVTKLYLCDWLWHMRLTCDLPVRVHMIYCTPVGLTHK